MLRVSSLTLLMLCVAEPAAAFDAGSPPQQSGQVKSGGSGAPGVSSASSKLYPDAAAAAGTLPRHLFDLGAGRILVDSNGVMSGLGGLNIAGRGGAVLFTRPALNLPDGIALFSGSSDFKMPKGIELIASSIVLEPSDSVKILPNPGRQGLYINATGPLTSPAAGALQFNAFFNNVNAPINGTPDPSDSVHCQCVTNFQSSLAVGPKFSGVEAYGGSFGVVTYGDTNTIADYVGMASGVAQNYRGISRIYGGNTGVTLGPKGTSPFVIGHETDVTVSNPDAPYRSGYNVVNTGSHRAKIVDGAFTVGCGVAGGCFKHLLALYTGDAPSIPNTSPLQNALAEDGDIVWSERAQKLSHVINLPNVTVTGTILNFPGIILTGAGKLITSQVDLYGSPPAAPAGHVSYGGETAPASKCGSLPGAAGCLAVNVGGTKRFVPFY